MRGDLKKFTCSVVSIMCLTVTSLVYDDVITVFGEEQEISMNSEVDSLLEEYFSYRENQFLPMIV